MLKNIHFISKSNYDTYVYHNEIVRILADFNQNLKLIEKNTHSEEQQQQQHSFTSPDGNSNSNIAKSLLLQQYDKVNQQPCFLEIKSLSIIDDNNQIVSVLNDSMLQDHSNFNDNANSILSKFNNYKSSLKIELYYTLDGQDIGFLESDIDGLIFKNNISLKDSPPSSLLDLIFKSNNKSNGLQNNFITSGRFIIYLELSEIFRNHVYTGLFEIHITVKNDVGDGGSAAVERFKEVCKTIGCKPVLIELPKGEHPTQVMTSSYHRGTCLKDIQIIAYRLASQLIEQQYTITRVKVEIMFSGEGVPLTEEELSSVSVDNYFEFHIKLTLPGSFDQFDELSQLVKRHSAHLSKNAFKSNETGEQQRFVTLRMYKVGKQIAESRYLACVADLESNNYTIAAKMREYSIYDSNVHLDKGWIEYSNNKH